jgi:hypothetical protein
VQVVPNTGRRADNVPEAAREGGALESTKTLTRDVIAEMGKVLSSPEEVTSNLDCDSGFCYFGHPIATAELMKYSASYPLWKAKIGR